MKRQILCVLLTLVMLISPFSAYVFAEENDSVTSSTEAEFTAAIRDLNENGGEKTIVLGDNIKLESELIISSGILNLVGNGHTLNAKYIFIKENAVVNLGKTDGSDSLILTSHDETEALIYVSSSAVLNMYKGAVLKDSKAGATVGGVSLQDDSTFNMYGGVIDNCTNWASVSGGVLIVNNATFNMYDGTIQNCSGYTGGAVGFGAYSIGGSLYGHASFNMYGGEIRDCTDVYFGGGGINAFSASPISINISGGKITGCEGTRYGYGGGIFIYTTDEDAVVHINGGEIFGNTAQYGGGIFIYSGNVVIGNNAAIYNNTATDAGDDIYSNGSERSNVTVGMVGRELTLPGSDRLIDGYYYDGVNDENPEDNGRYDPAAPCAYTQSDVNNTSEFALKAAYGPVVPVSGIILEKSEITVDIAKVQTLTLKAEVKPDNATDKELIWSSSDETIATVDNNGVVTLIQKGVVTITAATESGAYSASCVVTIICTHKTDTVWSNDAESHWKFCQIDVCGCMVEKAAHTFGEWTVIKKATATEKGIKEQHCIDCGYKRTEEIPVIGTVDPDKPDTSVDKSPQTGDETNLFLRWALIGTSCMGLFFAVAMSRKGKKS